MMMLIWIVTSQCCVLNINSLESSSASKYCGGNEGADGGGQERDVGVDVGSLPSISRGQESIE